MRGREDRVGETLAVQHGVQDMEDKPWRNAKRRSLEDRLPRLREDALEKAARNQRIAIGVGCMSRNRAPPPPKGTQTATWLAPPSGPPPDVSS